MNRPTKISDLADAILAMFPKCLYCGKAITDELDMVLASDHPHRVAHAACQKAKLGAA